MFFIPAASPERMSIELARRTTLQDPTAMDEPHDVEYQDGIAYLVGKGGTFGLVDVRTPDLRVLGSLDEFENAQTVLPVGNYALVAADAGGSRVWTVMTFPAYDPRDYVNPGSWASMGLAIPAAVGAAIANPDQPVAVLIGEGGLMMCLEELHTIVAESLDVTVFVFNNDDYAIISEEASRSYDFPDQSYGWAETGLDLVAVASGMGLPAERVRERDAVADAVERARARDGPALVEVVTDPAEPQASGEGDSGASGAGSGGTGQGGDGEPSVPVQ